MLCAVLDPLFIFKLKMGAAGAAMGTALAQTVALLPLLLALQKRHRVWTGADSEASGASRGIRDWPLIGLFCPPGGLPSFVRSVKGYISAGGFVLLRSIAKISAYSVCAREAARLGAVASAAHNMCFQLGVATTQLCESIAIATQTLLARELSAARDTYKRTAARHVVGRGMLFGSIVSTAVSAVTFVNRRKVIDGLTILPEVRAAAYAVMPLVLTCQVLKGLAYPVSGALMGALDWRASAAAMVLAQGCTLLLVAVWSGGGARILALNELWGALAVLFAVQTGAGLVRIVSGTGPWKALRNERPEAES